MPSDTSAALQALIRQVETLTTTVTDQQKRMDGLHGHNARLLDQIKDTRRDTGVVNTALRQNSKGIDASADSMPPGVYLTREEARDPRKYAEAKTQAKTEGVPLLVLRDDDKPSDLDTSKQAIPIQSKIVTFDDDHEWVRWLRADQNTGSGLISRRLQAERDGYQIKTFTTLDDLPDHARTKFELMEGAANANEA
jgi:hypothetical protein